MKKLHGDSIIGTYLDLSLNEIIYKGTDEEAWEEKITTLSENMTVSFVLSDELKDKDEYTVIRNHEGEIEELESKYDEETDTLTFETDKYSTYAIAYKGTNTTDTKKNDLLTNPKTGDAKIVLAISTMLLIIAANIVVNKTIKTKKIKTK